MRVIYKYPLKLETRQIVDLPRGSHILTLAVQNNEPMIWVDHDLSNQSIPLDVVAFGTGDEIPGHMQLLYLGTATVDDLMLHFYIDQTPKAISHQ